MCKSNKTLIYWSFWVPLIFPQNVFNSFFENYSLYGRFGYQHFKNMAKTQKKQQNSVTNQYFPIFVLKNGCKLSKKKILFKNICRRHIKSKINQLVFVLQWFEYINQFKDTPISMWLKLRDNIIGYGWIKVDVYK